MAIQQSFPRQTHSLGDGAFADLAIPRLDDFIGGFSTPQRVEHLPDHDARPFEGGLTMANLRVGHDVLAQLEPHGGPLGRTTFAVLHGWSLPDPPRPRKGGAARQKQKLGKQKAKIRTTDYGTTDDGTTGRLEKQEL